jgi:hypothetical protein
MHAYSYVPVSLHVRPAGFKVMLMLHSSIVLLWALGGVDDTLINHNVSVMMIVCAFSMTCWIAQCCLHVIHDGWLCAWTLIVGCVATDNTVCRCQRARMSTPF